MSRLKTIVSLRKAKDNPALFLLESVAEITKKMKKNMAEMLEQKIDDKSIEISNRFEKEMDLIINKLNIDVKKSEISTEFKNEATKIVQALTGELELVKIEATQDLKRSIDQFISKTEKNLSDFKNGVIDERQVMSLIRETIKKEVISQSEVASMLKEKLDKIEVNPTVNVDKVVKKLKSDKKFAILVKGEDGLIDTGKSIIEKINEAPQGFKINTQYLDLPLEKVGGGAKGGSGAGSFIIGEVPTGAINSSNTVFTIAQNARPGTVMLYVNGMRMRGGGEDYTISGRTITTVTAPPTNSIVQVDYEKL